MTDWTPDPGNTISVVALFPSAESATEVFRRCSTSEGEGGQLLYREGQSWLASIAHVEKDRVTNSNIESEAFVEQVARLLGTDVIDC
jgi:hypothetical protein